MDGQALVHLILLISISLSTVGGTILVVDEDKNETVFSTEETRLDLISAHGLKGRLVVAEPIEACSSLQGPPPLPPQPRDPLGWILLANLRNKLDGGVDCSLVTKTINAQEAGYSGIIIRQIGSNSSGAGLFQVDPTSIEWVGVIIFASIVGDYAGIVLQENFTHDRYFVEFEDESVEFFPLAVIIFFCLFLGMFFLSLIFLFCGYVCSCITVVLVEWRRRHKMLLSKSQLEKLPVVGWTSAIAQDICSICQEQFEPEAQVRVLPCSHVFHKVCIDPWLLKESRKCPNCKRRVLFPNERSRYQYSSEEEEDDGITDERTPLLQTPQRPVIDEPQSLPYFRETPVVLEDSLQKNASSGEPSSNGAIPETSLSNPTLENGDGAGESSLLCTFHDASGSMGSLASSSLTFQSCIDIDSATNSQEEEEEEEEDNEGARISTF